MMTMNELGEFNVPDVLDSDENRKRAYSSCKVERAKTSRDKECPVCGKPFHDDTRRNARVYCTQKCRNKARYVKSDKGAGEGPSPEENRLRQKIAELGMTNNELKRKIDKLKFTNAKLCREINEQAARIRELERRG